MKYTLKTVNDTHVLMINGKPSECPFKTGMAGLDNFQRPIFIQPHCTSQCPHFDLVGKTLNLMCAPMHSVEIEFMPEAETKPTLEILKP